MTDNSVIFKIDLNKLPSEINRLVFTAAIDGNALISQLDGGYLVFVHNETEKARFSFTGSDFSTERSIMILEIYLKDGAWKTSAVAQGFSGGLEHLVEYFGGVVAED